MNANEQWLYTDRVGAQAGPIPTAELQQMIASGMIPNTAVVWKEGMASWIMHTQVPELQAAPQQPLQPVTTAPAPAAAATVPAQSPGANPYSSPNATNHQHVETIRYGGIGRLAYIGLSILLTLAFWFGLIALSVGSGSANLEQTHGNIIFAIYGVTIVLSLLLMAVRLKNTGCNMAWVLLNFVPIANIVIGIRCICAQEGYSDTKKLDLPGKITAILILLTFILAILVPILFIGASAYKKGADRAEREMQERNRANQEQPTTR